MTSETDKAYIAGFFDGEGCVDFRFAKSKNGTRSGRLSARLSQNNKEILLWVKSLYGGSICQRKREARKELQYQHAVACEKARVFLNDIKPYLKVKLSKVNQCLKLDKKLVRRRLLRD